MKKNSQEWISGNSFVCIKEHFRLGILLVFLWGKTSFCSAQGDFFFNLYGGSTNLWSSVYLQLPTILINGIVSTALEDYNKTYSSNCRIEHPSNIDCYWCFK